MVIITQESQPVPIGTDAQYPRCGKALAPRVRVIVARLGGERSIGHSGTVHRLRGCWQLLVLLLRPALQEASAS